MNPTQERWLPIPGYEGYYEVSDHGNVRSVDRVVKDSRGWDINLKGKPMRKSLNSNGYLQCRLTRDGIGEHARVHQLVLKAFVGPMPEGAHGCHWDDDKTNNHLGNLRWASRTENMHDRVRNGRHYQAVKTHCYLGHEFTAANTLISSEGTRKCKACITRRGREYDQRRTQPGAPKVKWTKTHCKWGHEFTAENTYVKPNGTRSCKTCKAEINRRLYEKRKKARGGSF